MWFFTLTCSDSKTSPLPPSPHIFLREKSSSRYLREERARFTDVRVLPKKRRLPVSLLFLRIPTSKWVCFSTVDQFPNSFRTNSLYKCPSPDFLKAIALGKKLGLPIAEAIFFALAYAAVWVQTGDLTFEIEVVLNFLLGGPSKIEGAFFRARTAC